MTGDILGAAKNKHAERSNPMEQKPMAQKTMEQKPKDESEYRADIPRPPVPPPPSISAAAQAALAMPLPPAPVYPPIHDHDEWRRHVAEADAAWSALWDVLPSDPSTVAQWKTIAGVPVVAATPAAPIVAGDRVYLDVHGGALIYLGGKSVEPWARTIAFKTGMHVVSIDYRMPPQHPYPAGLDDCVAVYRALVKSHGAENIIVGGTSAGGNLAAALVLRARDEGIALPAALVLLSPEVDLTESGDSFKTLRGLDRLDLLMPVNKLYAAGAPLEHPYLSPLYGDFTRGFPPTFLQSGTRDLYLSNTVRMHRALRKANVPAELHIWEAMPHGAFLGAPEDLEIDEELQKFIRRIWTTTHNSGAGPSISR